MDNGEEPEIKDVSTLWVEPPAEDTGEPTPELAAALARVQAKLPMIKAAQVAEVETRQGYSYKYHYASLADVLKVVLPLLGHEGLALTQTYRRSRHPRAHGLDLVTRLYHANGGYLQSVLPIPLEDTAQALGSWMTYQRRYALCALIGVAAEEDTDAAGASGLAPAPEPRRPARRAPIAPASGPVPL